MANPLVTWWALLEQARASALVTTPGPSDNPQNALMVLSRAQRELQDFTNAVKRVLTITIDGTATDGGYGEPMDIRQPLEASFFLTAASKKFHVTPLTPEAMDALQREAQWVPPPPVAPPFVNKWYYTIDQGKVFIYPFVGVLGTFTLRYIPHLTEFQASNLVGDWSAVTLNAMATWMKANGPAQEFWSQAGPMSDYLAIDLMERYNFHKAYPERYNDLKAKWAYAKPMAVRNTPMQNKGVRMPRQMGIIK